MNEELRQLYEADQADRRADGIAADIVERDRARRRRVAELLDAGAAETGDDFFHAAMVFQHGEELADYLRAHELALRAGELGHRPGRWLAAAAYDRWLMHQGRPQKYGTQYRLSGDRYQLYDVDPTTTDEERAEWNVPPLAEAMRRAADFKRPRTAGSFTLTPAAHLRAGDLELAIHIMPAGTGPPPVPAAGALEDGDPVPSWLPPDLTAVRLGPSFGAVDETGEPQLGWWRPPAPALMGWREEDGPPPQPEAVEFSGGTGIWCRGAHGWSMLLIGRPDGHWMVAGKRSRDEVIQVAESLP